MTSGAIKAKQKRVPDGKAVTARHLPEEAIKPTMENPDIQHFFGKKLKSI